ncbi:MAG: DeoR/GlpR transcriptional regulator [Chloroflexi bacterium]|nr:MAG: DeoR/GlpR transcriptional regulator [Chloroflexota bacterium]TMC68381.1 MAG: DeoR/GlpR transcriptional regulator [Chloroflexota bacterium]
MLAIERRRLIAESVRSRGVVSVAEMAEALGTTEITLRRDLRVMAKEGLLVRTHGGAVQPMGLGHEPSYHEKSGQAAGEKAAIARLAFSMVRPGDSILLGPGTTTLALARLLVNSPELTVVTNSLLVAQALMEAPRVEVILTGGALRRSIHALVGPAAEESVRALRASQTFISGNGFSAERGLSTPSPLVAATDRALASAAQQVVVLADHTKIGQETMCQTVPAARIHTLITDSRADPNELAAIRETGVEVRVADVGEHEQSSRAAR